MDLSTDCCTINRCVLLLSAVISGTFPHPQTRFLTGPQYRRTSRSTHCASSGGRPNRIQGRIPDTRCTCSVTKDHWEPSVCSRILITRASGEAITYMTSPQARLFWSPQRVNWRMERLNMSSSVMRVSSVRMRVMDAHLYGVDLLSVTLRSAFAHYTQAPLQASWCGGPSVTTHGHIWCFCRVKYTMPATLHRCYCHFFDRPHAAAVTKRALCGV